MEPGGSPCHRAALLLLLGLLLLCVSHVADGNVVPNAASDTQTTGTPDPMKWDPFIVQEPSKEKAAEGETVVLGCQFFSPNSSSLSELTVNWYKDDGKHKVHLMENNQTVMANYSRAFISGDLSVGVASMTIVDVTTDDHGIYSCEVTLPSGETVIGEGVKVRIRSPNISSGVQESIGTIIGVVVAAVGVLIGLIIILTPRFRKHLPCIKQG